MRGKEAIKGTCFIISPIGPEESDIRHMADDFLELLVEPALARYNFLVIRADKIPGPTTITADIIRLVQESDLCIIDLTNINPNVFYECGRRHESGKPFIQMVRKGDEGTLPFDVAGIRTVTYDLSNPRSVLESQRRLQEWIDAMMEGGLETSPSGESLTAIAQAVQRLERQVGRLLDNPVTITSTSKSYGYESFLMPPDKAFMAALEAGNIPEAYKVLLRLKKVAETIEYIAALGLLVSMGEERALELLESEILDVLQNESQPERLDTILTTVAQVLQNYASNTGKFKPTIDSLDNLLIKLLPRDDISNATKAFVANKIGMLAWSSRQYDICIRYSRQAKALNPEPSYSYNLCLVYDHENMAKELESELRELSQMPELDDDHKELLKDHGYNVTG